MAHHLVRGQVAVGDVRVDRVVQQHLHVHVWDGGEPLDELKESLVVHHKGDGVVDGGGGRVLERLLGGAWRGVGGRRPDHVGAQLRRRLAIDATAAVARKILLLPRRVGVVDEHEPQVAVPRRDELAQVAKLLVEQPAPERGDDERLLGRGRVARKRLLHHHLHRLLAPAGVPEAPKLAAVAVALAQKRDRVVEEPLAVELRAPAAHVETLLPQLDVEPLERVVVDVLHRLQLLREELVRVQVERLQQALLKRDRCAEVAVVLVPVALGDHVDGAPPLHRVRRDGAQLDQHGAHPHAERQLQRVDDDVPLEDGVHTRLVD
mmetsp:Transcript_48403/g.104897  ORF Transcript_48403/g.104897 Transcript_48403/m.104897 type:complete len:320 (-) Transcript_48403:1638-2597(-)